MQKKAHFNSRFSLSLLLRKHFFSIVLTLVVTSAFFYAFSLTSSSCLVKGAWCGEDMDQYMDYSNNLLSGHGYSSRLVNNMYFIPLKENVYIPEIIRHPGFPLLLTSIRLFYNNPKILLFLNYVLYAGILFFTYKIAKMLLQNKWLALLVLCIVSFDATLLYFTALVGDADVLAAFAIAGFLYFFLKISLFYQSEKSHIVRNTIFASIFGILSVMSRDNTAFFILGIIVFSLILSVSFYRKIFQKKYTVIVLGLIFIVLLAWSVRLYVLTGRVIFSAEVGSQLFDEHIIFGLVQTPESIQMAHWYEKTAWEYIAQQRSRGVSILQANEVVDLKLENMTISYIIRHPGISWQHFTKGVYDIFTLSPFVWEKFDTFYINQRFTGLLGIFNYFVMLLFPVVVFFVRNKKATAFVFILSLWLILLSFLLVTALFHGTIMGTRASISVMPIISILVVIFIQQIVTGLLRKPKKTSIR